MFWLLLAPPGRFELPTFRLGGERCYPAELRGQRPPGKCRAQQLLYPFRPRLSIQNETAAAICRGGT